jgi:hypothetical protein
MNWCKGSFCNISVSILLGILVGYILYYFISPSSIIYKGPNSNIIKHQIFKYNGKSYRLVPKIYLCPIDILPTI